MSHSWLSNILTPTNSEQRTFYFEPNNTTYIYTDVYIWNKNFRNHILTASSSLNFYFFFSIHYQKVLKGTHCQKNYCPILGNKQKRILGCRFSLRLGIVWQTFEGFDSVRTSDFLLTKLFWEKMGNEIILVHSVERITQKH